MRGVFLPADLRKYTVESEREKEFKPRVRVSPALLPSKKKSLPLTAAVQSIAQLLGKNIAPIAIHPAE